jgi:hypothetical protein
VFGSFDTCLLSLGLAIKPCIDLCPNNKHGSGSVDGCGDSDSPGMNRWDDSESYGLVGVVGLDFFTFLSLITASLSSSVRIGEVFPHSHSSQSVTT